MVTKPLFSFNAPGRLDVLCCALWLAGDHHEVQSSDVNTCAKHAGCNQNIHGFGRAFLFGFKAVEKKREVGGRHSAGKIHWLSRRPARLAWNGVVGLDLANPVQDVVLDDRLGTGQFPHRVVIS